MAKILVGADVGGTKTLAAVAEGERELARADGPGAAVRPGRAMVSAGTIAEVARRALASAGLLTADVLLVGAAGAGRETERRELVNALRSEGIAAKIVVTTDIDIALAAAFGDGPGIVVSAGTGSVAIGRDRDGQAHRMGGYGWQMGDEGSGYAIGRAALGAVSRARDGRSPATALTDRVLRAVRIAEFDDLVRWAATATPPEVASLAPHVLAVADEDDPLAQGIVDYAARELCQLVLCLAPTMSADAPIPVAVTGGLLAPHATLRERIVSRLKDEPGLAPIDAPVDAVAGALRLAAKEI